MFHHIVFVEEHIDFVVESVVEIVLVVEMDAHAYAGADSTVHDGQFPVLAVVDLFAADEHRGAHEQVLDLSGALVGEGTEILAETEQLGTVRFLFLGGVVVVL